MIFFLDENFPKAGGDLLLGEGHQVFDIRGSENEGISDFDIFKLAQEKSAIFLTTDKDFFHTIPFSHPEPHGVIVFNLKQPNRVNLFDMLNWVLGNIDLANLTSRILLLRDTTYLLTEKLSRFSN